MILQFLMYCLLRSLFFHNYVILCLFSGARVFHVWWIAGSLLLLRFLRIASWCGVILLIYVWGMAYRMSSVWSLLFG